MVLLGEIIVSRPANEESSLKSTCSGEKKNMMYIVSLNVFVFLQNGFILSHLNRLPGANKIIMWAKPNLQHDVTAEKDP